MGILKIEKMCFKFRLVRRPLAGAQDYEVGPKFKVFPNRKKAGKREFI